jgi:hypothetical protein
MVADRRSVVIIVSSFVCKTSVGQQVAGHAAWAVIGWAVGGVAPVVLVAVKKRR